MKDTAKLIFLIVLVALVLAIAAPGVIFVWRLMESWTGENTGQLLGGALACLGGVGAVFAAMAGAGVFARLAGWKPPRRDDGTPPPMILDAPPGWNDRPQLPPPATAPPWGLTGGGAYDLLPAPRQDERFRLEVRQSGREEVDTRR